MADEIGQLTGVLNRMLASLEAAREGERRFLADASHELRTPVTTLLGNVEFAARHGADPEVLEELQRDARRLARLVDDLLALERGDAGVSAGADEVDLGEVVRGVVGAHAGGGRRPGRVRWVSITRSSAATSARSPGRSRTWSRTRSCTARQGGRVTISVSRADGAALLTVTRRGTGTGSGRPRPAVRAVLARRRRFRRGRGPGSGCRSSRRSSTATGAGSSSTGRRSRSICPPRRSTAVGGIDGPREFSYCVLPSADSLFRESVMIGSETADDHKRQSIARRARARRGARAREPDAAMGDRRHRRAHRRLCRARLGGGAGTVARLQAASATRGLGREHVVPRSASTAIPQLPPAANPSSLGLQGPDQPPQSIPSPPQNPRRRQRRRRLRRHSPRRRRSPPAAGGSCRGARERTT